MKRFFSLSLFTLMVAFMAYAPMMAQEPENLPNTAPADFELGAPDYTLLRPWANAKVDRTGKAKVKAKGPMQLPDHVHNGLTKYFPPRFNQVGGSCGSAADVSYQFTHEQNSYRDLDATYLCNRYPSHFTWLITYHGDDKATMMRCNGVPDSETYGGFPYSRFFGAQDYGENDYGVMQGYDRWFKAMHNRIVTFVQSPLTVETEEGRQAIKRWLYNHNGDESFHAGGVCGIGVAAGPFSGRIASTAKNKEIGVAGMKYVTSWNETYNHAMTVVGYDDRIEFDLDGNGVYGEEDKDEMGAWIVCNSWGAGWGDDGFMYCPYKHGGPWLPQKGGFWNMGMYYIRKDYRPLITMKILMDYTKRSEICLGAGVAADTTATKPESTILFSHFKYAGLVSGKGEDPEIPMLGIWVDGPHYEPLEFGYDLTDLTAPYDRTQPLKYFFFIDSKKTANGEGFIRSLSLMNYEYDRQGVEMPFDIKDVKIETKGKTTMVSLIARGEQLYKPMGLSIGEGKLTWSAPQRSSLPLTGYCVYADGEVQDTLPATQTTYQLPAGTEAGYSVAAVYRGPSGDVAMSLPTAEVRLAQVEEAGEGNQVAKFSNGGFSIPRIFESATQEATFEFWLKPQTTVNYNQAFGPGWGTFYFHSTDGGAIYYGWNTSSGNRSASNTKLLSVNRWTHVALTIKNNVMTLYINGIQKSTFKGATHSGLSALGQLTFGGNDPSKAINGSMDELRIWNCCRTKEEISKNKDIQIANPGAHPNLVAYYKMDTMTDDLGNIMLRDCAGGHHATLISAEGTTFPTDANILKGKPEITADIQCSATKIYAMQAVHLSAHALLSAAEFKWNIPSAGIENISAPQVDVIFPTAGEHTATLTVTDINGESTETTLTLNVEEAPEPTIDFAFSTDSIPVGERVGLINRSNGMGVTYRWLMPGAKTPEIEATNASAVYEDMGTHTVTLVATLPDGTVRQISHDLEACGAAPVAEFEISTDVVIKGEPIYLLDKSRYTPTTWKWNVSDGLKQFIINGRNSSFTPTRAGVYSVTLDVANDLGADRLNRARAFIVAAADSKNGLNFTGAGQKLNIPSPLGSSVRTFSVDFWLRPNKAASAFTLTTTNDNLKLQANEDGSVTIKWGKDSYTTPEGYIIPGEWHHYAIVVSSGKPTFYRDVKSYDSAATRLNSTAQDLSGTITIGGDEPGMMAQIDELRFWTKATGASVMKKYCNAPITDVAAAEADGLCLNYNFNQFEGNPTDLTSGAHHGERVGFGPDGDAWTPSKGVFTLNIGEDTSADEPVNITGDYLTNYKRPFYTTGRSINKGNGVFKEFEHGTKRSTWHIENPTPNEDGTIIAGVYVNGNKENDFCVETGWNGFPTKLSNHLFYQIADLPEGAYRFTAIVDQTHGEVRYGNTRLMAAKGETIPDIKDYEQCLASVEMTDEAQYIDFILDEPTQVALGMNINLNGDAGINISAFKLEQIAIEVREADGQTAITAPKFPDTPSKGKSGSGYTVRPTRGGLIAVPVTEGKSQPVVIYDLQGHVVAHYNISTAAFIPLAPGLYIADGLKVVVK